MNTRISSKCLALIRLPLSILSVVLTLPLGFGAHGQTIAHWVGSSGSWSDTNNWDIGAVPKNAGAKAYRVILDVAGDPIITVSEPITISGLLNREVLWVEGKGDLTLTASSTNSGSITAAGGKVRLTGSSLNGMDGALIAEAGFVLLTDATVEGGSLRVTDDAASQVRFAGDVTLKGVAWVDDGAGEFTVYNTSARLLGDYEHGLPAGCKLVIWTQYSSQETRLSFGAGDYQNEGVIEVRHSGGNYSNHPKLYWLGSGALLGNGEIYFNYANANEYERPWISGETGAVLTIGASQWIHGQGEIRLPVINQGRLEADRKDRVLVVTGLVYNSGVISGVGGGRMILQGGLTNTGSATVDTNSSMSISGTVSTDSDLVTSPGASLQFDHATVDLGGQVVVADHGIVAISDSTISNGKLRVTDNANSQVRFSGDVTLTGVPWIDDGAGEFMVYNTSAQLLGDYEHQLPAGYKLVVWTQYSSQETRLTLGAGNYQNDGMIEVRHSGGNYSNHPKLYWLGSGALLGNGEIFFNYANANEYERPWISGETGAVLTVGVGQWIHGQGEIRMPVINQGTLEADRKDRVLVVTGLVDNSGLISGTNGARLVLQGGLTNNGSVSVDTNSSMVLSGSVNTGADWVTSPGGSLEFADVLLNLSGKSLVADQGIVALSDCTISNGTLRVTDDPFSQVRFSGDVTFKGVPWMDDGAGEFTVYNTSARLLGDYEHGLPTGYTLVVWTRYSSQETRLTIEAGNYQNDGMIEVRHSGGNYSNHPKLYWLGSGALLGNGEVFFNYANANEYERPWITGESGAALTVGPSQWVHGQGEIRMPVFNQGVMEADRNDRYLVVTGVIDNTGVISGVSGGRLALQGGLTNNGPINLEANCSLLVSGPGSTDRDLVASPGASLQFDHATVNLSGKMAVGDRGVVVISDSTISNGKLRVTDNADSQVRFSGDVTLTGVPWVGEGAGEFMVYNTTARLLGDYEHGLPAGYKLVVWTHYSSQETRLTLGAGDYQNDGVIELRHSGGNYSNHPKLYWLGSGTLLGNGGVYFNYANANDYERPWISGESAAVLTVGASQWIHGQGDIRLPLTNQGTVTADRKDRSLVLTEQVSNLGALCATNGGRLVLLKGLNNQGVVKASDGVVDISGSLFLAASGALQTSGSGKIYLGRHFRGDASALAAITSSTALVFDGAGIAQPDVDGPAFFIEAEDFNFDRGQHEELANLMPYLGGCYQGRAGRDRIDYHQTDNRVASDLYRVNEGPGFNVNIYALTDFDRGAYQMTNNFKVGYNDPGDWYNYTRSNSVSGGPFYLFARVSGRTSALQVDEVTGSANTTSQTLQKLGEIRGPATGDWNQFAYLPMRGETNDFVSVNWSGENTFRVTILNGGEQDLDCFVLAPAISSGPAQLLEVMGQDVGPDAAGFAALSLDSLALQSGSIVQLVDQADNSGGAGAEALYVKTLTVPAGAVLDLNGFSLYAQNAQVNGTVSGGQVQQVTTERPRLTIWLADDSVRISWPGWAAGYVLQAKQSLTTNSVWQVVPDTPVQVGGNNVVTQSLSGLSRFYRLSH